MIWARPTSQVVDLRKTHRPRRRVDKRLVALVSAIVAIAAAGLGVWHVWPHQTDPKTRSQLLQTVSKLILLPTGEQPVIATVTNSQALPQQPFLEEAKNGDRLIIYTKAQKAYLYRPSINKLVDVGPVDISQSDLGQQ